MSAKTDNNNEGGGRKKEGKKGKASARRQKRARERKSGSAMEHAAELIYRGDCVFDRREIELLPRVGVVDWVIYYNIKFTVEI